MLLASGFLNCFNDLLIASAPTEIAGNGHTDFFLRWVGIAVKQFFGAHQRSWSAEATVDSIMVKEGFLERMKLVPICQTFDREDFLTINLRGEHKARIHSLSVHQDRACTALTDLTSPFCARQAQLLPQQIKECQVRANFKLVFSVVDGRCNGDSFHALVLGIDPFICPW